MLTLTIHDLLEDPQYKAFFCKIPVLPESPSIKPPWRLFIQLKGDKRWRIKDFDTYPEAFNFLKKKLKAGVVHDAAIHCRRFSYPPPVVMKRIRGKYVRGSDGKERPATKRADWKPKLPDDLERHDWCPWCRRPTVFKYYTRHHALQKIGLPIDPSVARCNICGASTRIATYRSAA